MPGSRHLLLVLALGLGAPAAADGAVRVYGSDLTAPAERVEERQSDTAYWPGDLAGPGRPGAPADGQVRSVRIKGIALRRPDPRPASAPGGETQFRLQTLRALSRGRHRVRLTSQGFDVPTSGGDQQITTYRPTNLCVRRGEKVAFNTVGGWDGVPTGDGPYPDGTPLQLFGRVAGARTDWFQRAGRTNNGSVFSPRGNRRLDPPSFAGRIGGVELLMQVRLATGRDRSAACRAYR